MKGMVKGTTRQPRTSRHLHFARHPFACVGGRTDGRCDASRQTTGDDALLSVSEGLTSSRALLRRGYSRNVAIPARTTDSTSIALTLALPAFRDIVEV